MSKYGTKCDYENAEGYIIHFDSIPEKYFYQKLELFKEQGKIKDFVKEPAYELVPKNTTDYDEVYKNIKLKPIIYYPDFLVTLNDDSQIIVDVKGGSAGVIEEVAKIKRKILLAQQPNIPVIFIAMVEEIYLGGCPIRIEDINKHVWVTNTPSMSFYDKIRNKYKKLYPSSKGKTQKEVKWTVEDWVKYFEFTDIDGLFYTWNATKKK